MKLSKKIGFVVFLAAWNVMGAQQSDFRLGFQLHSGISWMTTNRLEVRKVGSNFTAGIAASGEMRISDRLSATTGLGLSFGRGGTLRHKTGGNFFPESRLSSDYLNSGIRPLPDGTRLKYSLQYLDVPIALKWRLRIPGDERYLGYYIEAPMITWGLAVQSRGAILAGDIHARKENISRDVSTFCMAWGFGAGVEYLSGTNHTLICGVQFNSGLNDITSDRANSAIPNPDDNPFDPDDDYIPLPERSRAIINVIAIKMGVLF